MSNIPTRLFLNLNYLQASKAAGIFLGPLSHSAVADMTSSSPATPHELQGQRAARGTPSLQAGDLESQGKTKSLTVNRKD